MRYLPSWAPVTLLFFVLTVAREKNLNSIKYPMSMFVIAYISFSNNIITNKYIIIFYLCFIIETNEHIK